MYFVTLSINKLCWYFDLVNLDLAYFWVHNDIHLKIKK